MSSFDVIDVDIIPGEDIVFKTLFSLPENKYILIDFLNKILKRDGNNLIQNVILNDEKFEGVYNINNIKCMSIKAETKSKEIINIEIQTGRDPYMFKSFLYNASGIISRSLSHSEKYESLPKIIIISILSFDIFYNTKEERNTASWLFTIKDKFYNEKKDFKDLLNINFIELQKYQKLEENHIEELRKNDPWILFLNNPNDIFFRNSSTPSIFTEARTQLIILQNDKEFNIMYEAREKQIRDEKSRIDGAIKKGRIEGIKEAIEKEKEEERKRIYIYFTFKLLKKYPYDLVLELSELDESEVQIIYNFLNSTERNVEELSNNLNFNVDLLKEILNELKISSHEMKKRKL